MNNCANCKWWGQSENIKDGWGWCILTAVDQEIPEHKDSKAIAFDHEGYYAVLHTRPDFGCVQWEEGVNDK